jgi:hypothetical protein
MENEVKKWYSSSVNPAKISLTLKALIPLIVFLLPMFGFVDITPDNLNEVIDGVVNVIIGLGSTITAILFLYGLARKFFVSK